MSGYYKVTLSQRMLWLGQRFELPKDTSFNHPSEFVAKYSRMDQIKFVEDSP